MRPFARRLAPVLIGAAVVLAPMAVSVHPSAAASQSELQKLQAKLNAAQSALKADQTKLSQLKTSYKKTLQQLYVVRDNLRVTKSKIAMLQNEIETTSGKIAQNKKTQSATQSVINSDQQDISTSLQALEVQGTGGLLAVLLSSQSFSDFVSRLGMVRRVEDANIRVLHNIQSEEAKLQTIGTTLASEQASLTSLEGQAKAQAASEVKDESGLQTQASALVDSLTKTRTIVNNDQADEKATHDTIVALESAGNGRSIGSVHFVWPVHGPITSPFGMRLDPVKHKWWLHTGIDIGIPMRTPIHAAAAGTVILAGWVRGYGNTLVLDHGDGITTLYAHQTKLLVHDGEHVTQGEVVGLSGMTGWATGPHLHFEIRIAGKPVNPIKYLPKVETRW